MQIRSGYGGTLYTEVSCSIIQTSGSDTNGTILLELTSENTANLSFDTGKYDLEIVSGSTPPYVEKVLSGQVKLYKEITT